MSTNVAAETTLSQMLQNVYGVMSFESDLVSALAKPYLHDEEFWQRESQKLRKSVASTDLALYRHVIRCHMLLSVVPGGVQEWLSFSLQEVEEKMSPLLGHDDAFYWDTYTVGTIIGLFELGTRIGQRYGQVFDALFLAKMGTIAVRLFNEEVRFVNCSPLTPPEHIQQHLDRAVKEYLRPQDLQTRRFLQPALQNMLRCIENQLTSCGKDKVDVLSPMRSRKNGDWLLLSLLHGAVDMKRRTLMEILVMAHAVV